VSAFRSDCDFFSSHSLPITQLILDNETSDDLSAFFRQQFPPISFQPVPPQNHRTNSVERSIRTTKSHFISVLASAHATFPPARWHLLLSITKLNLNHMRGFSLDPTISAWHGLKGLPLDFSAFPIHSPGQLVVPNGNRGLITAKELFTLVPPYTTIVVIPSLSLPQPPLASPIPWTTSPTPLFPFEGPPSGPAICMSGVSRRGMRLDGYWCGVRGR
jgi:hypothetical protein